ncbi:MAG: PKD domain-containing protein [Bacteroidota bacterium]
MRPSLLSLLLSLLFTNLGTAQTDLFGIVNQYAAVLDIDPCLNSLRLDQVTGFQTGDRVLLIQMQGAQISSGDNADFGTVTDLGRTGFHEKGTIASIAGEEIFLENALLHDYDINGRVQLVRIASHASARITAPLLGQPWNGQTGGIIALEIENTLEILSSGTIDATGIGFRGGTAVSNLPNNCTWVIQQNDYYYSFDSWRAAAKGEGIAAYIPNREAGKGPQANGGGGGNDHNSGGGGGALFSRGGEGGTNREPSLFGCQGDHPGLGGRALPDDPAGRRLYLGGGGGAGHGNNNRSSNGGNGGGIILVQAQQLLIAPGTTTVIRTNGADALGAQGDGGGGGGAAGHCVLDVMDFNIGGDLRMEALGGNGASVDNLNRDRCHGPGGAGSGGVIDMPELMPPPAGFELLVGGGDPGVSRNSSACPDSRNEAQAGSSGSRTDRINIAEGTTPSEALSIVSQPQAQIACEGDRVCFDLLGTGTDLSYVWEADSGSGFQPLSDGGNISGSQSATLIIDPVTLTQDGLQLRASVSNACFGALPTQVVSLQVLPSPLAQFTALTSGSTITLTNTSANATTYSWDFGDGQSSTDPNPSHTYAMDGTYTVTLTATNACGSVTTTQTVTINTAVAPVAAFLADQQQGCAPLTVQFTDQSLNNATAWDWSFPGGTPATATVANPLVSYANPGVYDVTLRVSNGAGVDEENQVAWITVLGPPTANFNFVENGGTVQFTSLASDADSYLWDFGDGQSSTAVSPLHTYAGTGNYLVRLTVTNDCGTDVFEELVRVDVLQLPTVRFTLDRSQGCTPLTVQFTDQSTSQISSWEWLFPGGNPSSSTEPNPVVRYETAGLYDVSLRVSNAAGATEQQLAGVVRVEKTPRAEFAVVQDVQDPYTFTFTDQSEDAQSIAWDFGDGSPFAFDSQVRHTYAQQGTYTVILTASNAFCSALRSAPVGIYLSSTSDPAVSDRWRLWPNPTTGWLHMAWEGEMRPQALRVLDATGRQVYTEDLPRPTAHQLDLSHLATGLYLLQWRSGEQWVSQRVVIQ